MDLDDPYPGHTLLRMEYTNLSDVASVCEGLGKDKSVGGKEPKVEMTYEQTLSTMIY